MTDDDNSPINHSKNQVRVSAVMQNGRAIYADSEEALREFTEACHRGEEQSRRRRELWGEGGADAMPRLCKLFPSLRNAPGCDPWDSLKMLDYACSGASHGATLAARFVLSVWNSNTDWDAEAHREGILTDEDGHLRRFDLFEALGTWDYKHHEAFLMWARDPFWP